MNRFRKGTLDHDGDGRMGGSMKGTDMTKKEEPKKLDEGFKAPTPATQEKPAEEYNDDKPMKKAPNKDGTAAFDGEEGLRARNATMSADFKGD